ncbi:MAG: hypothetical protein ACRDNF_13265 [Streptosporangiaceae bacterium]
MARACGGRGLARPEPGTLITRKIIQSPGTIKAQAGSAALAWAFVVERVTRIELALVVWCRRSCCFLQC